MPFLLFAFALLFSPFAHASSCQLENIHEIRFRTLWENPALKGETLRFFRDGLLAQSPALNESFVAEIERLMAREPRLRDGEIYDALAKYIYDNGAEFKSAYGSDIEMRRERRATQLMMLTDATPTGVLDIGAGNGKMVARLAERWHVPIEKTFAVEVVDYRDNGNVSWLKYLDGGRIPLDNGAVDFETLLMVLHHTDDPDVVLREAFRVLAPGGTLVVREHDARDASAALFNSVMDELFYRVFNDGLPVPLPNTYKPKEAWAEIFERVGFTVVKVVEPEPGNPFLPVFFVLKKQ